MRAGNGSTDLRVFRIWCGIMLVVVLLTTIMEAL